MFIFKKVYIPFYSTFYSWQVFEHFQLKDYKQSILFASSYQAKNDKAQPLSNKNGDHIFKDN